MEQEPLYPSLPWICLSPMDAFYMINLKKHMLDKIIRYHDMVFKISYL